MVALATADDVEAALRRSLLDTEDVAFLLEEASDLVVGYLRYTPDPIPGAVVRVVAAMVAAALTRPAPVVDGAQALTAGPVGVRVAPDASAAGPRLTRALELRLNPYRRAAVVSTSSEHYDIAFTVEGS